jgi:HSP20 family protein
MSNVRHNRRGLAAMAIQDEIRQVFDRLLGESDTDPSTVVTSQWVPRVDIREEAALRDLRRRSGRRSEGHRGPDGQGDPVDPGERVPTLPKRVRAGPGVSASHGVFHRRFALPDTTDANAISASGRNGVLEVVIPKRPETTPRRIQVQ